MKGWETTTKGITKFDELPKEAKAYVKELAQQTKVSISFISTGQKRHEIIKIG
jgi:adenylosuccinate synthase